MWPFVIDPVTTYQIYDYQAKKLVSDFPAALEKAINDYATFKASARFYSANDYQNITGWFKSFPDLWEGIRENYKNDPALTGKADKFAAVITQANDQHQLGFVVSTIVIAGIIVAASFGVAGIIWAIGYLEEQRNISTLIDETAKGNIPANILDKAVSENKESWGFSDVAGILSFVGIGIGIYFFYPIIKDIFAARRNHGRS